PRHGLSEPRLRAAGRAAAAAWAGARRDGARDGAGWLRLRHVRVLRLRARDDRQLARRVLLPRRSRPVGGVAGPGRAAPVLRTVPRARMHAGRRRGLSSGRDRESGSLDVPRTVLQRLLRAGAEVIVMIADHVRLRAFWDERYERFSLSESGWFGAGEALNDRIYACKIQALERALAPRLPNPRDAIATPQFAVLDDGCGPGDFTRI